MQRTLQLDINDNVFDKVLSSITNLMQTWLPQNTLEIREIKSKTDFFYSITDKYIFALTQLDGENRQKILGINSMHYKNREIANQWKKDIAKYIHPDKCNHLQSKKAWNKMMELYNEMVS